MTRILSEGEHEYLQGEVDVEEGSARERTIRNRIRKHVKEAVREFGLLIDELEDRDKELIFEELGSVTGTQHTFKEVSDPEPSLEYGLTSMVAFVYECCQNSNLDFEDVVEHAIGRYYEDDVVVEMEVREIEAMTKHLTRKAQKEHGINIGESQS